MTFGNAVKDGAGRHAGRAAAGAPVGRRTLQVAAARGRVARADAARFRFDDGGAAIWAAAAAAIIHRVVVFQVHGSHRTRYGGGAYAFIGEWRVDAIRACRRLGEGRRGIAEARPVILVPVRCHGATPFTDGCSLETTSLYRITR